MSGIGSREREAVQCWFAKMDAANDVWEPLKTERSQYQDCLENVFPRVVPGNRGFGGVLDADPEFDQVNVNLVSRVVTYVKSKCFDASPEIRIAGMRDIDVKLSSMNEHLLTRVMERGGAPKASRAAVDDMATLGLWAVWLGIDSYALDHRRLAGFATSPDDLVVAAAQGEEVHPILGMDLLALAATARNVHARSQLPMTEFQKLNLLRLAGEAEEMFQKESKKPPSPTAKRIWYRATPYGEGFLVDSNVCDMADADWMARKINFSVERFRSWEPFKPGPRKNAQAQTLGDDSAHRWINQPAPGVGDEMNQCFAVWEIWCRATGQVHYVTEGWPGYLEKDSTYPYTAEDGLPAFDDFYPCEIVVPYMHNKQRPDRPLGVPMISFCFPQQLEVIKFESAIVGDAKRGARIYEVSPGLNSDQKQDVQDAVDGTMLEKTQEDHMAGRHSIESLPNPPMGSDKLIARKLAEEGFFAMASVAPSQITGEPVAATLGQEELVSRGAGDIQGDILSMIQTGYSNLARKTAILIRLSFTQKEVGRYLDMRYTTPVVDGGGKVVERAPFDLWKAESLDGVQISASFATKGEGEDPQTIQLLLRAIEVASAVRDSQGIPYKDPRPLLEKLFKAVRIGYVPDYEMSDNELKVLVMKQLLTDQRSGQGPGGAPPDRTQGGGGPTGTARKRGMPPRGAPDGGGTRAKDMVTSRVGPERPE